MAESQIIFKRSIIDFLKCISIFTDRVVFNKINNKIEAVVANNECIFKGIYSAVTFNNIDDNVKLNIPDVKKLYTFFSSLSEQDISLSFHENYLKYNTSSLKMKYHLLENGIINECKLNINKALTLDYDVEFELTGDIISSIIKLFSFNGDASKLYFYTSDNNLYCDIADKTKVNTDEMSICIQKNVSYNFNGMIIPTETLRILNTINFDNAL